MRRDALYFCCAGLTAGFTLVACAVEVERTPRSGFGADVPVGGADGTAGEPSPGDVPLDVAGAGAPDDGDALAGSAGTGGFAASDPAPADANDAGVAGSGGTGGMGGTGGTGGMDATGGTGGTGVGGNGCFDGPLDTRPRAITRKIKDLTGTTTSSGQFGVGGTDLGIAVRQPDGQIAYIFGDTFEQDGVGGPGWRAPVLLRSDPGLDADGIVFNGAAGGSYAKQILPYDHNHPDYSTWLPSDAITIGDRMYLHFIVNAGLGNVRWSQIAYSDDDGENWTLSDATWDAAENGGLRQLWTWERGCDGYVYTLSTSFINRVDPIILHRVPEDELLDKNAYEPWGYANGAWAWGNPATVVLDGAFGEMSLRRVEHKWVLAWFNAGDYEITIKVFDSPTSNLYTATTYHPIHGGEWGSENDTTVAQLYGGYIHPDSTLRNLHLIVSQWNTTTNWPYRAMQFVTGVE